MKITRARIEMHLIDFRRRYNQAKKSYMDQLHSENESNVSKNQIETFESRILKQEADNCMALIQICNETLEDLKDESYN
jgi:hypothetical protein